MKQRSLCVLSLLACCALSSVAAELYVDPVSGDDANDGLAALKRPSGSGPFKTSAKALSKAVPGDSVLLAKGRVFAEGVKFNNVDGEPGRPIVLDGQGVTVNGLAPLDASAFSPAGDGLFKSESFLSGLLASKELSSYKPDPKALLARLFLVFDGRVQRMGRTCKGPCAPFKKPDALAAGEWTYDEGASLFYVKIAGSSLKDAKIEYPSLLNGVSFSGSCSNIVVKNIVATGVVNDGFNLHGKTSNVRFENVAAVECGDDGVSAHEECDFELDGFASYGCATGVCNIGKSKCKLSRMRLEGATTKELFSMEQAFFEVKDVFIDASSGDSPLTVAGNSSKGLFSGMALENVAIVNLSGKEKAVVVQQSCALDLRSCGLYGVSLRGIGDVKLSETVLTQGSGSPASLAALRMQQPNALALLLKKVPASVKPANR